LRFKEHNLLQSIIIVFVTYMLLVLTDRKSVIETGQRWPQALTTLTVFGWDIWNQPEMILGFEQQKEAEKMITFTCIIIVIILSICSAPITCWA